MVSVVPVVTGRAQVKDGVSTEGGRVWENKGDARNLETSHILPVSQGMRGLR